ncbi:MAG: hypothetical protein R2865_11955 [Deinococcales bacterium]
MIEHLTSELEALEKTIIIPQTSSKLPTLNPKMDFWQTWLALILKMKVLNLTSLILITPLYSLLLGHNWPAQSYGAPQRWCDAQTSQRTKTS